ncbi:MAG: hypothetical protein WAU91_00395 [Desulfatitalea sp.]
MAKLLEYLFGLNHCQALYERIRHLDDPRQFMRQVLTEMEVQPAVSPQDVEKIPAKAGAMA